MPRNACSDAVDPAFSTGIRPEPLFLKLHPGTARSETRNQPPGVQS